MYLVQKPTTEGLQVWDCLTGDSYSSCYDDALGIYRIELTPSENYRKFIVVSDNSSLDNQSWYHIKSSNQDFEIRQNDITPDIKTRGKIVYNAYSSDVIHLSDSSARNYLFCELSVSEDSEIGTFELSTSSVSSGWRSIVVSNAVVVSVFRRATENQFRATSLIVNGIGTYTSEIYTNFKFRVSCSEESGIRVFTDPNTLSTDDYYTELPYDGYFLIRFAITKWPITIPDDEYLIKIYSTDSDVEFSGIDVIAEDSSLEQSYIDTDQTIQRRLFFLENDNALQNSLETNIVSNKTPTLSFTNNPYSSELNNFKESSVFTGYTYRKHNIRFNLTRPRGNFVYNEYYPITNFTTLQTNISEYGGLKFYTYVKGLTNRIWIDDITEYTGSEREVLVQALQNKKNTEFNVYFDYQEGSERVIRIFSRYVTANNSIWKFEDSGFWMVGNEHMELEDYTDWTSFTYTDNDFTRYYRDYTVKATQENSGDTAIYVGSVTVMSMVNYDNLEGSVESYLIANQYDIPVVEERIDTNYARNNILPVSYENIKINFYQLGKQDSIVIEDLEPFTAVGSRREVAVSSGLGVSVISAVASGITNCSVESQVTSGKLNLSVVTYPRVSVGILTTDFRTIINHVRYQNIQFRMNVVYTDSIGVEREYEKLLETTQNGYTQAIMVRSRTGTNYYAIGPSLDTTIELGQVSTEGETVEILCGVVSVNTSGPIDGSFVRTPELVWTKNSASYSFDETSRYSDSSTNLTIEFPKREPGEMEAKEFIFSLADPSDDFNTTGYSVRFTQGSVDYFAEFEDTGISVLSDGTVIGNVGYMYFGTNIQESKVRDIVFESDNMEILEWDDPIKISDNRYGVKLWFTPNGTGDILTGNLKLNYLGTILDEISVEQGHFSLRLKPYEASYSLVPVEKERAYRDFDLHNFITTDEDVTWNSNLTEPVMIVSDSQDDHGISIQLESEVHGNNFYFPTKQVTDLIVIVTYHDDPENYITETTGKDHLIPLDSTKNIETVEILAKSGWEGDDLTITFGDLELNYEPSLDFPDFNLPTGSTSTWEGGVLVVEEGETETLTFECPEYLEYFGNKLTFNTQELVTFDISVTYRDGITVEMQEEVSIREHSILLDEKKLIQQIVLSELKGTNTFTGIELSKSASVTLGLARFDAVGEEIIWDATRFILRTLDLEDHLEIDLGLGSKYEGIYTENQVYLETTENAKLRVVIEYTESNEITDYTDSGYTKFHHIEIPVLTKIRSIKIYNTEIGRIQFAKDIQINPTEY